MTPQSVSNSPVSWYSDYRVSDVRSHHRGPQRAGPHAGGEPQAGECHHGHARGEKGGHGISMTLERAFFLSIKTLVLDWYKKGLYYFCTIRTMNPMNWFLSLLWVFDAWTCSVSAIYTTPGKIPWVCYCKLSCKDNTTIYVQLFNWNYICS